jgi:hypothetical protein
MQDEGKKTLPEELTEEVGEIAKKIVAELSEPHGSQETQCGDNEETPGFSADLSCPHCGERISLQIGTRLR